MVNKWTKEEDNFLIENYPDNGPQWCGEKLDRTKGSAQKRAKRLGVKSKRVKSKYKEDDLVMVISKAKTLSDVLRSLNLRCAGGNYQTIKKYIKLYKIDTSHFEPEEERLKRLSEYNKGVIIPLDEILIENSSYNRRSLKKRLIEESIMTYQCSGCGNRGEWNGEQLTLQLEHINGVHNDNRIENLDFLCPNCHSQTATYAGKNSKK
jgi:uncharacterized protein YlaI